MKTRRTRENHTPSGGLSVPGLGEEKNTMAAREADTEIDSTRMFIEAKLLYLDLKENTYGRFLKVRMQRDDVFGGVLFLSCPSFFAFFSILSSVLIEK